MGWKLFKKTISQLYYNLADAVKLTGIIWLAYMAIILGVNKLIYGQLAPEASTANFQEPTTSGIILSFFGIVLIIVFSSWIAVSWHRYMLLDNRPTSIFPQWRSKLVISYIWKSFKLGLVLIVPFIVLSFFLGSIIVSGITHNYFVSVIFETGILTLFGYFFARIAMVLPGAAIGRKISIGESWDITGPVKNSIWFASFLVALVFFVLNQLAYNIFANDFLNAILSFGTEWLVLMIGISILTTLYGVLVEKRDLD